MSGKIIKVAVARSSAPSCAPGDWVVKIGQVQVGADKGKYSVAVFAAEHVDEARTFAVALSAAGDPFDVTVPDEASGNALLTKSSLKTFCDKTELDEFCSGGAQTERTIDGVTVAPGAAAANVPIVLDGEIVIIERAKLLGFDGDKARFCAHGDDDGIVHLLALKSFVKYLAAQEYPVDLSAVSGATPLLSILRSLPTSARLQSGRVCARELQQLAATIGMEELTEEIIAADIPRLSGSALAAFIAHSTILVRSVAKKLAGKEMGGVWPPTPAELGTALKERMRGGAPPAPEAPGADSSAPPAPPSEHPLSTALKARCSGQSEFDSFLAEAVAAVPLVEAPRQDWVKASSFRMRGALERELRKRGVTVETITSAPGGSNLDAEHLVEFLLELIEGATPAAPLPLGGAPPPPAGLSSQLSELGGLLSGAGSKGKGSPEEKAARSALRDAARRLTPDDIGRMRRLQALAVAGDHVNLNIEKSKETSADVLLILSSDFDDIHDILSGTLPEGDINVFQCVRLGLSERLLSTLFPRKAVISNEVRKNVSRAASGSLSNLKLLELVGLPDSGTSDDPLKGVAKLPAEEGLLRLSESIDLIQQTTMLVSPAQASEAMQFFRELKKTIADYRRRGAWWPELGAFVRDLFKIMQKPASVFAKGGGGGGILLDLKPELLSRTGELRVELDEVMTDRFRKYPGSSTLKPPKAPSTPATPSTPSTATASPSTASPATAAGRISADEWKERSDKLSAGVPDKGGKAPCRSWFILGSCKKGDKCIRHHDGTAGSF